MENLKYYLENIKLNEKFSSWKYTIPDDMEKFVYDFYALTLIDLNRGFDRLEIRPGIEESLLNIKYSLKDALQKIVDYHYDLFSDYLPEVCVMEALYNSMEVRNEDIIKWFREVDYKYYRDNIEEEREYNMSSRLTDYLNREISGGISEDLLNKMIKLYRDSEWTNYYGGEQWAKITESTIMFINSKNSSLNKKIVMIDHIYDLQHNTGTVLSKCQEYGGRTGYHWVEEVLDHKRNIIDSWELYDYISNQLKNPYAFYVYHTEGVALEDYLENQEEMKEKKGKELINIIEEALKKEDSRIEVEHDYDNYYYVEFAGDRVRVDFGIIEMEKTIGVGVYIDSEESHISPYAKEFKSWELEDYLDSITFHIVEYIRNM